MSLQIKKAERLQVRMKLAITGLSGSGKTLGALLIAKGLVPNGRVLVIDSEDGSSNLYADSPELKGMEYDVLEIDAPYTVLKYTQALELGQKEKYDVIIIDSLSHPWAGEGGLLEKKDALDNRGGKQNSFSNWRSISKEHEIFKSRIVHAKAHVIATMRSKQDYILASEDGKQVPKRAGLAPIQREGIEYEFTTVFDVELDHSFVVSKDRTGLFDGRHEKISEQTGAVIREWISSGKVKIEPGLIPFDVTLDQKIPTALLKNKREWVGGTWREIGTMDAAEFLVWIEKAIAWESAKPNYNKQDLEWYNAAREFALETSVPKDAT